MIPALRERVMRLARVPPPAQCTTLLVAGVACGRVQPAAARLLAQGGRGLRLVDGALATDTASASGEDHSRCLLEAAQALVEAGLAGPWRHELLAVRPAADEPALAHVDRCVVRILGITTHSVHLNGYAPGGRMIVSRRSPAKRVDPGLWDTLAGGMVASGESALLALAREAWEEAGLDLEGHEILAGGRMLVERPVSEGHLCEWLEIFDVYVPEPEKLANQDGEVDTIELRTLDEILSGIDAGVFTVEAALSIFDSVERRGSSRESARGFSLT